MTKRCETGIPSRVAKSAARDWETHQLTLASATVSFVGAIPKYPEPGTPEFTRCMPKWYAAYCQARIMDEWLNQIGTLQGQLNSGQPILDALVGAYQDCMEGTPV